MDDHQVVTKPALKKTKHPYPTLLPTFHPAPSRQLAPAFQVACATIWTCLCLLTVACCTSRMSARANQQLLVYFQPFVPPVFMLWLWAHAVRHFENKLIKYEVCFSMADRKFLISSYQISQLALTLTTLCSTLAAFVCIAHTVHHFRLASSLPALAYCLVLLTLSLPTPHLFPPTRMFFLSTLSRVFLPVQAVSWSQFLLADMMTSLSKSFADVTRASCSFAAGALFQSPSIAMCAPLSPLTLFALTSPFLIRFIQCLIVYNHTGNRAQIFNAIKYLSSFPAVILTAMEHEAHVHGVKFTLKSVWIAVMIVNTLYSFYWDVEQDWDMPWVMAQGKRVRFGLLPSLRPDSLYSASWYVWLLVSNLFLRLMWTHRLIGNLEAHNTVLLLIAVLEVVRRYQWTFVRVETELRKLGSKVMKDSERIHDKAQSPE